MITLNKYLEELQKLKDEGYGELPVIYSSDNEGNSYHPVTFLPDVCLVEDLNKYSLERIPNWDDEKDIIDFKPNSILIN